jgi:hypothetical protein
MNLKLSYLTVKCLLSLSYFKQNQKLATKLSKNREIKKINLGEILSGRNVAVSCGRAEGRDKADGLFFFLLLLCERATLLLHATWQACTPTQHSVKFSSLSQ